MIMNTIAKQLGLMGSPVTEFPFNVQDENGKLVYTEYENGYWTRREWDSQGRQIYFENSAGFWIKTEWDENGKRTQFNWNDSEK